MAIRLFESNGHKTSTLTGIGDNSMVLDGAFFLQQTSGIVEKATAGVAIIGVNETQATFTSDNETVAKKRVSFVPATADRLYEVEITGGTITVADEGKYYNLTDADTVNGATESIVPFYIDTTSAAAVDAVIALQVKLVKFISATKSVFSIVSL